MVWRMIAWLMLAPPDTHERHMNGTTYRKIVADYVQPFTVRLLSFAIET